MNEFQRELAALLNRHSIDNRCETPDFILADHIDRYLYGLANTMRQRERWFGGSDEPAESAPRPEEGDGDV